MADKNSLPISIELRTEIFQEGQLDEHYFNVPGQFVTVGNNVYLRYQEPVQEGETTEPVNVTIKIEPDGSVQLIRADEHRMRLRFSYQEENYTNYRTPYGAFQIRTVTSNIRVTLKDRPVSGNVAVDYELYGGEERLGVYHLRLQFTA